MRVTRRGVLAAVALGALLATGTGCRTADESAGPPAVDGGPASAVDGLAFELYFPAAPGQLIAEEREIAPQEDAVETARALLQELLAGPRTDGLAAPLPAGVTIAGLHLSASGTLFVDLAAADQPDPPRAGVLGEMLMVYSLVDTILLNVADVRAVVLLWNGQQRPSFAGHLDTRRPLTADAGLIVRK